MSDERQAKRTRNEHRSLAILEAVGYRSTRSAGSPGEGDIIGIGATHVVLCQVKMRDWPATVGVEILRLFPVPSNTPKLLRRWRHRQSLPDVGEL